MGSGEAAMLIAALEHLERLERAEERAAERARLRELAEADAELGRYCRGVQAVFMAAMEARGFHLHARSIWRKIRMSRTAMATTSEAPAPAPRTWTHAEVQRVTDRAQGGDASALAEFRVLLRDEEWGESVISCCGSAAGFLNERLIRTFAGPDGGFAIVEAMTLKVARLRTALTPADASPVEKLLASRVATCWLATAAAEFSAAAPGGSPHERDVRDRRVHRCHARLLSSIRALEAIRKPSGPSVAVQVNVATAAPDRVNGT